MNKLESEVRYYSRIHPVIFSKAKNSIVYDRDNNEYIDFFCGAGSSNYGHNNDAMKGAIIDYLQRDGVINSLDQLTDAKNDFINTFNDTILTPRSLDYKIQFTGPTGTNAVEAALKLARKFTGREKIIYFENSFHGMTYGSMSVSGMNNHKLAADYKTNVVEMPFANKSDSLEILENHLNNCNKVDLPAGIILETIQAEGGVKVAPKEWLEEVARLAKKFEILLIVDEIQTGCGRTGTFFSFEIANITPDIVCLSKSLSGFGLPLSINLLNPKIDCWSPGEHNGTFRGNNLAFIAATVALNMWSDEKFSQGILERSQIMDDFFKSKNIKLKGKGLMKAFETENSEANDRLRQIIFDNGVLVDTCGPKNNLIKMMPPINISTDNLLDGLNQVYQAILKSKLNLN
jgi:diaminobutyrate-2-oxoglutarate transaminase